MASRKTAALARRGSEEILEVLRRDGGRITSSRRAVVDVLLSGPAHPSAEEVVDRVRATLPDVDRSTVYRILSDLETRGVVHHVHLGHGPAIYHLTDELHAHIVCEGCGLVEELSTDALRTLTGALRSRGFVADVQHFAVTGRCRSCAEGEPTVVLQGRRDSSTARDPLPPPRRRPPRR